MKANHSVTIFLDVGSDQSYTRTHTDKITIEILRKIVFILTTVVTRILSSTAVASRVITRSYKYSITWNHFEDAAQMIVGWIWLIILDKYNDETTSKLDWNVPAATFTAEVFFFSFFIIMPLAILSYSLYI